MVAVGTFAGDFTGTGDFDAFRGAFMRLEFWHIGFPLVNDSSSLSIIVLMPRSCENRLILTKCD